MSITNDLRAYADSAVNQGKQTLSTAQAQLSGVTEQASEFVNDLRSSAEKVINVEALQAALEPYVTSLLSYGDSVAERVDELVATLKNDPRFGKLVQTADSLSSVVLELVQDHVVKPVQSLAGGTGGTGGTARKPAPKPAAKRTTKPAATRPATRKPAAKTTARKAPAKKATPSS